MPERPDVDWLLNIEMISDCDPVRLGRELEKAIGWIQHLETSRELDAEMLRVQHERMTGVATTIVGMGS